MNVILTPPPLDTYAIAEAAEALAISEFDFFRLAFRHWSGREADDSTLEKVFVAYLYEQKAPHWARHLCREVLRRRRNGTLDPEAFGVRGLRRRYPVPRLGRFSWSMMTLVVAVLLLMAVDTTYVKHRQFPTGCPGFSGSKFLDQYVGVFVKSRDAVCPPFAYPERKTEFGLK